MSDIQDYAIFLLDTEGRVATWNRGAERIKGYAAAEIVGEKYARFYPSDDVARGLPEENLAIALRDGHYVGEGWRVRKDGTTFWASVAITPLYDAERRHLGFTKVTRDLSERRDLLEKATAHAAELERRTEMLEARTQELRRVNDALQSFSYSVSHDLRAPVRGMWGYATAILEDYGAQMEAEAREYVAAIIAGARRMDELITSLLHYNSMSSGEIEALPIDAERAAREAVDLLRPELLARSAVVTVDGNLPKVMGHYASLVQVFSNLISNAAKFVREGVRPEVRVWAGKADDTARFWVEDNGIGIEPGHWERIFQPFERLHGVTAFPGTGIGLAVVRKAIERMHGRAGVESEPGAGSRFWLELPLAKGEADGDCAAG